MGEVKLKMAKALEALRSCGGMLTAGVRVQVRWLDRERGDTDGAVDVFHQISGAHRVWSRWQEGHPLPYVSPNAPSKGGCTGYLTAVDSVGPQALLARHRDSLRRRESGAAGREQSDQRGRSAPCADGDARRRSSGLAGRGPE